MRRGINTRFSPSARIACVNSRPFFRGQSTSEWGFFTIPSTLNGEVRQYIPDFIAAIDDGHGADDLLNVVIEVRGEQQKDMAAKVAAARMLWTPAICKLGGFGRWPFVEVSDPWLGQRR